MNERICASALYYYDCENITESFLAFRQRVEEDEISTKAYGQVSDRLDAGGHTPPDIPPISIEYVVSTPRDNARSPRDFSL